MQQSLPISLYLHPLKTTNLFSVLLICLFQNFYINRITQYVAFLTFFHLTMFLRFMHVIACSRTLFFFMVKYYLLLCINYILFIYPVADLHLRCFQFFAIMNNASVNICVQHFVQMHVFCSLGCTPRSGITGSHGNSV